MMNPFSLKQISIINKDAQLLFGGKQNFLIRETSFPYQKLLSADGKFRLSAIGNF